MLIFEALHLQVHLQALSLNLVFELFSLNVLYCFTCNAIYVNTLSKNCNILFIYIIYILSQSTCCILRYALIVQTNQIHLINVLSILYSWHYFLNES